MILNKIKNQDEKLSKNEMNEITEFDGNFTIKIDNYWSFVDSY